MYIYSQALKEVEKKIDIIRYDYEYFSKYDSIDHVRTRIKSPESIINKMNKDNLELTYKNMIENIHDIAGLRIICPLKSDIYTIIKYIREFNDLEILKEKDYVSHPKESGYTSYHMIVSVPVIIDKDLNNITVEIQIRSLAMDFWANFEHKVKYKNENDISKKASNELIAYAKMISNFDNKMMKLKNI